MLDSRKQKEYSVWVASETALLKDSVYVQMER